MSDRLPAWTQGGLGGPTGLGGDFHVADKDTRKLLQRLRQMGIRIQQTKKSHIMIYAPKGIVITSGTPSENRTIKNLVARLRRNGVDI